jgi:uncharacterized membrane protein HdeD (DUF308 family)
VDAGSHLSHIRGQCFGLALLLGVVGYVVFSLPDFSAAKKAVFVGLLSIMGCVSCAVIIYERRQLRRLRGRG